MGACGDVGDAGPTAGERAAPPTRRLHRSQPHVDRTESHATAAPLTEFVYVTSSIWPPAATLLLCVVDACATRDAMTERKEGTLAVLWGSPAWTRRPVCAGGGGTVDRRRAAARMPRGTACPTPRSISTAGWPTRSCRRVLARRAVVTAACRCLQHRACCHGGGSGPSAPACRWVTLAPHELPRPRPSTLVVPWAQYRHCCRRVSGAAGGARGGGCGCLSRRGRRPRFQAKLQLAVAVALVVYLVVQFYGVRDEIGRAHV